MATSRSFGGRLFTTRSPIRISPAVIFSRPAIIRSKVDLPQPDGPTRTTNSPSLIPMSTPWMTLVAPKAFFTSRIATDAIHSSRGHIAAYAYVFSYWHRPDLAGGTVLQIIGLSPFEKQARLAVIEW